MSLVVLGLVAAVLAAAVVMLAVALIRARRAAAVADAANASEWSKRRSLERDLQGTKDRLELAVRSSDVSIWEFETLDGPLEQSQPTLINFWEPLGYDPTEVPRLFSKAAPMVLSPEDLVRVPGEIMAYLNGETARFEQEHQVRHRDGSLQWRLSRGVAVRDGEGRIVRFIGTHVDTTRMKQIEADLQSARRAAELANRAKDEFLANVSHEIRTPMNAILGMTEAALEVPASEHQRQLLSTVQSAARSLLIIINDLLDVSKIGAGKLALEPSEFSLRTAIEETTRALVARAHQKGLKMSCDVERGVPDALVGDGLRVRQVLMNLLGNAIKFTDRGEIALQVSIGDGAGPADDVALRFAVKDTGIGISRDKQAVIFRAFEQADPSTTRKYGGTGLGLTISAQLAVLMGGDISVESAPGRGSTFVFRANFARAPGVGAVRPPQNVALSEHLLSSEVAQATRPLPTGPRSAAGPIASAVGQALPPGMRRRSLRILVAEDNEFNVALLREWLVRWHHQAEFVADGRAALALAAAGSFDLLLLDLHMPEVDGFEVARSIRAREVGAGQHLPIIALTARSSMRDRERCLAAGMDEFLPKPIDRDALSAAIEKVAVLATAPAGSAQLLDGPVILRACGGEAEVLETLGRAFRSGLPAHLARLRAALSMRDVASLRHAAHSLGGSVSVFSTVAATLASALEERASNIELAGCGDLVQRLEATCWAVSEATRTLSIERLRA